MADTATQDAPADTADQSTDEPNETKSATDGLGDAGKRALDAERKEKRAAERRAAEFETRLKEFEDRDKTEAQKVADRASAAEKRAGDAESALARLQVALDKGLTPNQAKRLVGTTREELEADADELLADIGDRNQPRTPRPDPTQGKPPAAPPQDPRAADLQQIEADIAANKRR